MDDFLLKLRNKPIHTRRTILIVSTVTITAFIFFIWLYFWAAMLNSPDRTQTDSSAPASLIKDNWKNLSDTFKNGVSEMRNQLRF